MLIIKISGGLGNQLFQLFFCNYLKERFGVETAIDPSSLLGKKGERYRKIYNNTFFRLDKFNVKHPILNKTKQFGISLIRKKKIYVLTEWFSKITFGKILPIYRKEDDFDEIKINSKYDYYFDGHWIDYRYVKNISKKLINEIKPSFELSSSNQTYLKKINKSNSVSIHCLRGVKVEDLAHRQIYHTSKLEYFLDAYEVIKSKVNNPKFIIFSNDTNWIKKHWPKDKKVIFIDNDGPDYEHHYLMQKCKHNIIDNSTYSYTAALLNSNEDNIVIAPKIWSKTIQILYPKSWIIINN